MIVPKVSNFYEVLRKVYEEEISIPRELKDIKQVHIVVSSSQYNGSDSIIFSTATHTPNELMKALTSVEKVFGNTVSVVDILGEGANAKIDCAMVYLQVESDMLKEALRISLNTARIATEYAEKIIPASLIDPDEIQQQLQDQAD